MGRESPATINHPMPYFQGDRFPDSKPLFLSFTFGGEVERLSCMNAVWMKAHWNKPTPTFCENSPEPKRVPSVPSSHAVAMRIALSLPNCWGGSPLQTHVQNVVRSLRGLGENNNRPDQGSYLKFPGCCRLEWKPSPTVFWSTYCFGNMRPPPLPRA